MDEEDAAAVISEPEDNPSPRRRSRRAKEAAGKSMQQRHQESRQRLMNSENSGDESGGPKSGSGGGWRSRNGQRVDSSDDEAQGTGGTTGTEGESGSGSEGEEDGDSRSEGSWLEEDGEGLMSPEQEMEVEDFKRVIRGRNPGDVEEYFALYLRHQIQAVLKDDPQEGEGKDVEDDDEERDGVGQDGVEDNDEQHAREVCLKVERDLADLRDKCVASEAWKQSLAGFITALTTRPYARLHNLDPDREENYDCGACNRAKAHATRIIEFYGPEYQPDWVNQTQLKEADGQGSGRYAWLKDIQDSDELHFEEQEASPEPSSSEDSEKEGGSGASSAAKTKSKPKYFAIGNWCAARVRLFHRCLHYRRQVQDQLQTRMQLLRGDPTTMANTVLEDHGFVEGLLNDYIHLKDLCREYLEKGYTREPGGSNGHTGFLVKVHKELDWSTARPVRKARFYDVRTMMPAATSPQTPARRRETARRGGSWGPPPLTARQLRERRAGGVADGEAEDDMPIVEIAHMRGKRRQTAGSSQEAAPKKRGNAVQTRLVFQPTSPGLNTLALAHAASRPRLQPSGIAVVQGDLIADEPMGEAAADPSTAETLVALGARLAEFVRLQQLKDLQLEFGEASAGNHQERAEGLRQECLDLLGRLGEENGVDALEANAYRILMLDGVSQVYMRLLAAVSRSPRNTQACADLISNLRMRLGD